MVIKTVIKVGTQMAIEDDTVVHMVSGGSDPKKVGSAVAHAIAEGKRVQLRYIGAGAGHQANKSLAIANYWTSQKSVKLAGIHEFTSVPGRQGEGDITAMLITVITL